MKGRTLAALLLVHPGFRVLPYNFSPISLLLSRYFYSVFHDYIRAQFETRVQFDAATRLRSGVPFGSILNLIDARSIPIIGARFPSSRSVLDVRLLMLATRVPLMSLTRSHERTCHRTTIIVLSALPIVGSRFYG